MRKVELEQGSPEWLAWRKSVVTATDAPILMGASPYATPYKGWQRKVGLAEEQPFNSAMGRGQRDEPVARQMFIDEYGIDMHPAVIESTLNPFCGASLDGISECGRYLLEIKSNGDHYHNNLSKGIPDFHQMQIQHQLLCTDSAAEMCFYFSYNNGSRICKEIYPDKAWLEEYLEKAKKYWENIVFFEPPAMTLKDYRDMNGIAEWKAAADNYQSLCSEIKKLDEMKEYYKRELTRLSGEESCMGSGVKVIKKVTKGRVDYESIPELLGVNLEQYRKPASSCWMVTVDRK